jgi:AraC family transcriptional regulator, transcriptional activator of pobA
MSEIPMNSLAPSEQELKVLPLGDFTPYDFYKPHRHDYFELFFFAKGGGKHFIDFIEYKINDRSVHIVFPQQIHLVNRVAQANGFVMIVSRAYLNLLGKMYYPKLLPFYHHPCLNLQEKNFEDIIRSLHKLSSELSTQNELAATLAQNYASIILTELIRAQALFETDYQAQRPYTQHEWTIYKTFVQLLEEHYLNKRTVQFYAESLNLSEKVLNNCIRKVCNKTCASLIQERTLIEAKRLLIFTGDSVKEIAYALNFQDSSYFTRFFARMEHKTPKEFKSDWEEKYHS